MEETDDITFHRKEIDDITKSLHQVHTFHKLNLSKDDRTREDADSFKPIAIYSANNFTDTDLYISTFFPEPKVV